ncbi:uncharacterized protein AFUA_6G14110 [Aspergillus fumigatus Af293]|uniref:Uncharacterized protein n=2 Tax=Aspergillus fumigatus TaxID=746128 RepID=Q4WLB7_ASPFU|nr:hypothetical protein AFUA_6G14110 [Aspergillus fumigatus Af293]EAL89247.1 hypothetical protein AFUA_6G14110 [Aspergillus fumigatus Af293]EDP55374.1 hypothetical protein AFUB_000640 [Aspergillus fumigatus A1163]
MIFYWSTRSQLHHATVEEDCSISETFGAMLTAMMMIRTNRFLILLSRRDIGREGISIDRDAVQTFIQYCDLVEFHWRRYLRKLRPEAQPRCCLPAHSPAACRPPVPSR